MICDSCDKTIFFHTQNVCPKCGGEAVVKPKKKRGRPVTKTPEEKKAKRAKWHKKNPRTEYFRNRKRVQNGVVVGQYVIELDGKWKRRTSDVGHGNQWDTFSVSHTYNSLGFAKRAVKIMGKGVVMERMETEEETRENWRKNKPKKDVQNG